MGRVEGKVAIVTGAAQGIGEACARVLAREGARVVVADLKEERGRAVAAEIGGLFVRTDVTSLADWDAAVAVAQDAFGGLHILVNNAGGATYTGPMADEPEAAHRRVMEMNVTGSWAGMRAVTPAMAAGGGGSIVNISSMDGLAGIAGMASYAASKFAVTGLTRSLALEVGDQGVRVNAVHPGFIATPLTDAAPPASRARLAKAMQRQPLKRWGRPEEVANCVLFLASDEASFCTGASLVVDGGHIAGPHRDSED